MRYKTLLKLICVFIVSTIVCVFCIQSSHYKSYVVPGTVFSKNIEQYAHGKHHRNMSTRYIMCVKPNDTNKFKHYSVYVDYTTYCTHNIGDKIAFSIYEDECIRDFKHSIWVEKISRLMVVLFGILSICFFTGIVIAIIEPYLDSLWFPI